MNPISQLSCHLKGSGCEIIFQISINSSCC